MCVKVQLHNPSAPRSIFPARLLTALSAEEPIILSRKECCTSIWFKSSLADFTNSQRWSRGHRSSKQKVALLCTALYFHHPSLYRSLWETVKVKVDCLPCCYHMLLYTMKKTSASRERERKRGRGEREQGEGENNHKSDQHYCLLSKCLKGCLDWTKT